MVSTLFARMRDVVVLEQQAELHGSRASVDTQASASGTVITTGYPFGGSGSYSARGTGSPPAVGAAGPGGLAAGAAGAGWGGSVHSWGTTTVAAAAVISIECRHGPKAAVEILDFLVELVRREPWVGEEGQGEETVLLALDMVYTGGWVAVGFHRRYYSLTCVTS
jgi:hypothetical protein